MSNKLILTFEFDDENDEHFRTISNARNYKNALRYVRENIFRPARKHGYSDSRLNELIKQNPVAILQVIELLEEEFNQILNDNSLSDSDI